jgi:hypothetical protein
VGTLDDYFEREIREKEDREKRSEKELELILI